MSKFTEEQKRAIVIETSGTFLTEQLPDNYDEMETEKLEEFCKAHAWYPFEDHTGEIILVNIVSAADNIIDLIEDNYDFVEKVK